MLIDVALCQGFLFKKHKKRGCLRDCGKAEEGSVRLCFEETEWALAREIMCADAWGPGSSQDE